MRHRGQPKVEPVVAGSWCAKKNMDEQQVSVEVHSRFTTKDVRTRGRGEVRV